jgi:predicted PurR-regulated permease PerM
MATNLARANDLAQFTRRVLIALALVTLAILLWKIAPVFILAFAGIVFAEAIRAGGEVIAERTRLSETAGVMIVGALALIALILAGWLFGRQIMEQTTELYGAIDAAWVKLQELIQKTPFAASMLERAEGTADPQAMGKVLKGTFTVAGAIVDIALVIFLALYFAVDPRTYQKGLLHLFPLEARERVQSALRASSKALRKWMLGQLVAMSAVGVLTAVGLWLVGVPLAIPLGIIAGLLDFVPVVGPMMAAIPGILIAFSASPQTAFYALLVYLFVQFVEGNVVTPLAQRWAVSVPPALTLLGIVAFGAVFGVMGVLFAMPMLVVTMVLVQKLYVDRLEKK